MEFEQETLELFYAIVHPRGDKSKIVVADEKFNNEFSAYTRVTPHDYRDRDEAIREARKLAAKYGLEYILFRSSYIEEQSEYLGEFESPASKPRELGDIILPPKDIGFLTQAGLEHYINKCREAWTQAN